MRKTLFTILIVCTFSTFGFSQKRKQEKLEIPTVGFCELTGNPEKYVDRIIRTEANYIVWWESSYLYSDDCKDSERKIHNESDCAENNRKCLKSFSFEWKKLKPYLRLKNKDSDVRRAKAVFVGRFVGADTYGQLGSFNYELRIKKVEKPTSIPKNVSWEGL